MADDELDEIFDFDNIIKMEVESDDEDPFIHDLLEAARDIILDKDEDPLLSLTPVVYTTKLDEMKTVKQDLTDLSAGEILKKLHSESTPIMTEVKKRSSDPKNMKSLNLKLAEVISYINDKAKSRLPLNAEVMPIQKSPSESENGGISVNNAYVPKSPNAGMLPNSSLSSEINKLVRLNSENIESFSTIPIVASELEPELATDSVTAPNSDTTFNINTDDYCNENKEYKRPCCVILKDIKYLIPPNQVTVKLPLELNTSKANGVDSQNSIEADVEMKQEENETSFVDVEMVDSSDETSFVDVEMVDSSEIQTSDEQNIIKIKTTALKSNAPVLTNETYTFLEEPQIRNSETDIIPIENMETRNKRAKITYSSRPKRTTKPLKRYECDPDVDDVPNEDFEPDEEDLPDKDYAPKHDLPLNKTKKKRKKTTQNVIKTRQNDTKTDQDVSKTRQNVLSSNVASVSMMSNEFPQNISKTGQNCTKTGRDVSKTKQTILSTNSSNAAFLSKLSPEFQFCFQEKFSIIVLINKYRTAYLYRVNCTKLVMNHYVIENCNEYKIAEKFTKEDKFIESYCCWYKREQSAALICSRKSFPFTILKFLKQPHTCYQKCHCCCSDMNNDSSQSQQKQRLDVIKRSRTAEDSFIRGLLNKTNSTTPGLVNETLNYIPTPINEKPVTKQSDKYLENYLLCLKNCRPKLEYDLYEIGRNGDILKVLLLDDEEQIERVRKTYELKSMPINDVELCCWFSREKLMHELKMLKTSPATLKLILKAHSCNYQQCLCCCKPALVTLLVPEFFPSTFKLTNANKIKNYELTISYIAKSKKATRKSKVDLNKSKKKTRSSTTRTSAVALSGRASKDNTPLRSINLMDKIKNVTLGINSSGELETVLKVPAKNLSVPTLKLLSDILAISAEEMVEFNLTAEEFCKKINSKSEDSGVVRETAHETSLISTDILEPPPPQAYDDDNGIMYVDHKVDIPITMLPNKTVITGGTHRIKSQSELNEPPTKIIPGSKLTSKGISSMYELISSLMERKNENCVQSFKSFFNKSDPLNITQKPVDAFKDFTKKEVPLMPIIKETFSLTKSQTVGSAIVIPGPSGATRQPGGNISTVQHDSMDIQSSHQTPSSTEKQIKTYKRKRPPPLVPFRSFASDKKKTS